jgi:hypothetical protein
MAFSTLSRKTLRTAEGELITRETVATETPASSDTSLSLLFFAFCMVASWLMFFSWVLSRPDGLMADPW